MKKSISLLLVLALVLTSGIAAFAAESTVPTDVKGTKYEAAVKVLLEKDVLSGYPDGTFGPANAIDRAEACTIVVKAMKPTASDLDAAKNRFDDMQSYDWALDFVNYGAEKNVVSGYGNGQFKPANSVTYNEMATMLVKALGYTDKDLNGTYPDNYVTKAKDLGIFKDVVIDGKGDTASTRGDVALMTATVADKIAEANKPEIPTKPTTPDETVDNGKLTDFSGRAYGMILDTSQVLNSKGDKVDQIEFLMRNKIYYLNTDGKVKIPDENNYLNGSLYCLSMTNGVVKKIGTDGSAFGAKRFAEFTTSKSFEEVTALSKTIVTTGNSAPFNIMNDAIFYVVNYSGSSIKDYESGNLRDIEVGDMIRAFDVTDDGGDLADIVIIVKAKDAGHL